MFGLPDVLIGESAVLILLLPVLLRPLLKKHARVDSAVTLAPLAFVLSLTLTAVYGFSYARLALIILSTAILLTNMRALQRFASRLYVDSYSTAFRIAAGIELILVVCSAAVLFYLRPHTINPKPQLSVYTGSFERNFKAKTEVSRPVSLVVYEYGTSFAANTNEPAILFVPDTYEVCADYELYAQEAVKQQRYVIAGDFYRFPASENASPSERFYNSRSFKAFTVHKRAAMQKAETVRDTRKLRGTAQNTQSIEHQRFIRRKQAEIEAMLVIAGQKTSSLIIAAQGDSFAAASILKEKYPGFISAVFNTQTGTDSFSFIRDTLTVSEPLDALFLFYGGVSGIGDFYKARRLQKAEAGSPAFAKALAPYIQRANVPAKIPTEFAAQ
ncbi:MAG: hypothetical protein ACTTIU_07000 [Treponema lecithinolyticum]|uniref:hypothetical protein n=1 Tax=Treponema lecithinolyticum TaxID=53418 RepID=UPI003FA2D557